MPSASSAVSSEANPWVASDHEPFAGKYLVERVLGQGGMGTVFEARHIRLQQRVAIKVLGSALREHPELVERFEREARACGSLSSAHAVRIIDIDATEDGTPFIVMELLDGRDLSQILEAEGPQTVSRAVRWVTEACDAIAEAHRLGIVHRDLKPGNLFLCQVDGRALVKVLDFGIAKRIASTDSAITQALSPLGTPQYMSPEQVRAAKDVDARSDVWSLGVTLYELVCGRTPFADESASACIAAVAADPVPDPRAFRPTLDAAFVEVLLRALAKKPDDRYQSVEELVAALAPFASAVEDRDVVSAVRRSIKSHPELPPITPIAVGASCDVRASGPRSKHESSSDRTAPPATSASVPVLPNKSRVRPRFAFAAAAAMGIAVFAAVARLASPLAAAAPQALAVEPRSTAGLELPSASTALSVLAASPATASVQPASAPVLPATAPVLPAAAEMKPVAAPLAPPPSPAITARPLVARPLVAALEVTAPASKAPLAALLPPRAKNDRPATLVTASRGVHGGLTSPGF